ncbi:MAG: hypothetical protein CVV27_11620 [Candidatus Melainabacteria bacterium HGW-Melainabacteria-1]|nr:MAG: hypothetical protein CVV27_11620 [Candidatus Melainabacteria bacterium HGW-Melainabacteria-1]
MNKTFQHIGLGLAALCVFAPSALAAVQLEPVASAQQQVGQQGVNQSFGRVAVSLRHVADPGSTVVFHPNGAGKLSDTFSPYDYRNIVKTQVFQLTIQNNEGRAIEADQLQIQVSLNGLPYEMLDRNKLIKQWRHYYYLNTNTITGAPDFMEQERAISAEHFIEKTGFQPKDIPAGGELSGLIAVPALQSAGTLRFRIRNLGPNPQDFTFNFNAREI